MSGVYQALNRICFSGIAQELCGFEFVIDVGTSMMNMSLELWFRILESAPPAYALKLGFSCRVNSRGVI